jgi:hypothetical protein
VPEYIQAQIGHSSVKVAMDVYSHLMQTTDRQATEKLAGLALGLTECSSKTVATKSGAAADGTQVPGKLVGRDRFELSTNWLEVRGAD